MKEQQNIVAVFDFDGTITTKDTLFDFIAFYWGKPKMIFGLIVLSPILISFKMGLITNDKAKERLFSYFFKKESQQAFLNVCKKYSERINEILNAKARDKIKWHQAEGHKLIIVSASVSEWIKPWATSIGINDVVGTEIEVVDGILTGRFASRNCYGQEKVNRLYNIYPHRDTYTLYAYGDSSGDKELLSIADYSFYRKF